MTERFLLDHQGLRQYNWLSDFSNWLNLQELPRWLQKGFSGIVVLLLPPILGVALIQQLLNERLFGIPEAIFAGLILIYSFGPVDLDQQISRFTEAIETGDKDTADSIANKLLHEAPPNDEPAYTQAITESILEQANSRIFAVIFWFLLLGPVGALLYRLTNLLIELDTSHKDLDFFLKSRQLMAILDWAPARLTAFTYAIAGSFEDALYGWRSYHEIRFDEFSNNASGILICTGSGALRLTTLLDEKLENSSDYHYLAEAAMGLVWRSLVVWLVILIIFTLAGWI